MCGEHLEKMKLSLRSKHVSFPKVRIETDVVFRAGITMTHESVRGPNNSDSAVMTYNDDW